jgi:hypothetical protein
MTVGKPGIVTVTDNAGTFTAGIVGIMINGNSSAETWAADKDTTLTALAAKIALRTTEVTSCVYSAGSHTITITPLLGVQLSVIPNTSLVTGTMTMVAVTTPDYPSWATGASVEMTVPSSGEKAAGYVHDQKPPASWFNWIKNLTYLWILYFEDMITSLLASVVDLQSKTSWISDACNLVFPDSDFTVEQTIACAYSYNSAGMVMLSIPNLSATSNSTSLGTSNALPTAIRPTAETMVPCVVRDSAGYRHGIARIYTNGQVAFEIGEYSDIVDDNIFYNPIGFTDSGTKGLINMVLCYKATPV